MKSSKKSFAIIGNWKMNPDTREEAKALFSSISKKTKKFKKTTVVIAPPAPFIRDFAGKSHVHISAQDVSENGAGAFTGSISARELKSAGAEYTIIGHSERRKAGDSDEIIAKKTKMALEAGLRVVLCIGEEERDAEAHYLQSVRNQILVVLNGVDKKLARWISIAYEPAWAIGKSYDTALKSSDIHEMSIYIKKVAAEILGKRDAMKIPVLYGGSVNFENAKNILKESSVNGLLIGRISLDPKIFSDIISYANSI